jgi:dephospho-CoA kinase
MTSDGRKPVIGLAGAIGAGKSFVARLLAECGCAVIDSDQLACEVTDRPVVRKRIAEVFGPGVLDTDGRVDRRAVAARVFGDRQRLEQLESIIHPLVHEARHALRDGYAADLRVKAIVEDCPLLFEAGLDAECDVVIFVRASSQTRLARVAARGWSEKDLADREKNQLGLDFKCSRADYVIDNDEGKDFTRKQVASVLSLILQTLP